MNRYMTRSWSKIALVGLVLVAVMACAKKTYIYVDYQLPPVTDNMQGRTVFIEVHDLRNNEEIFNYRAKKAFENFTGLFSLSLLTPDNEKSLKGAYTLPILFETAFKERLQTLGIGIAEEQSQNTPIFRINLKQFQINLVGQKWMADVSYEASLTQDNQTVSREAVTGSAENLKLLGSSGAEKIMSAIFTDMINRLDVQRLFQQANL